MTSAFVRMALVAADIDVRSFPAISGAANITVTFAQVGFATGQVMVRDLWQHADLGSFATSYTAQNVPSHGIVMLRLTQ